MCGIVGAIADRDVVPVLIEGLKRLEYRGYDSAGIAVVEERDVRRVRRTGRVGGAAGAWSGRLARTLGIRLPLLAGKGYAVDYEPSASPRASRCICTTSAAWSTRWDRG